VFSMKSLEDNMQPSVQFLSSDYRCWLTSLIALAHTIMLVIYRLWFCNQHPFITT
jgi:hypothetical protein